jgi:hypothetical protein
MIFFFKQAFTTSNNNTIHLHSLSGSYVTDPIKYINTVTKNSKYITIGGDYGGTTTKLGITYNNKNNKSIFDPVLIFNHKDIYESLSFFNTKDIIKFTGESSQFNTIFEVLQHIINTRNTFLNGDWSFINTILGIGSPSSSCPCPICLVKRKSLNVAASLRTSFTIDKDTSQKYIPLLSISPHRIVPLPLHLFLGIGNKIIKDILIDELGVDNKQLQKSIQSIKTIHSHRSSGVAAVHTLNGIELSKWIEIIYNFIKPNKKLNGCKLLTVMYWLQQLKIHLLHNKVFTTYNLNDFIFLVDQIQSNWEYVTNNKLIPKIHMLSHAIEFIKQHKYLGLYSESPIEHSHYMFNKLYRNTHYNMGGNTSVRIKRSHSDLLLQSLSQLTSS